MKKGKGSLAKKIGLGLLSVLTWPFRAVFGIIMSSLRNIAVTTQEIMQHFIGAVIVLLLLMFLTYNPWGGSYVHWVTDGVNSLGDVSLSKMWIGAVLAGLWFIALWWSLSPLGIVGTLVVVGIVGGGFGVAISQGYIATNEASAVVVVAQTTIVIALAIGATIAMARRKATSQVSTDNLDIDDE